MDLRLRKKGSKQPVASRQKAVRSPSKSNPLKLLFFIGILTFCLLIAHFERKTGERPGPVPSPFPTNERGLRGSTTFLDFLVDLARLSTTDLRKKLYDDDVFQLAALELESSSDACPLSSSPAWLPPAPPTLDFRNSTRLLWYEHVSKAGGTSFCKLAQANLRKEEVPTYFCMPRDGDLPDGRVGRWTNEKLLKYRTEQADIRIVSNEWQPFPVDRWQLKNQLFLVTTLRDPLDRLLSAYHFWGILHNQEPVKPSFAEWLERKRKRSVGKSSQDMGNAVHIGRYNFIVWKFSTGLMPQGTHTDDVDMPLGIPKEKEDLWLAPFVMAAETLAKFDLVLILELMSSHSSQMLTRSLGWTKLDKNHVVPSGKVQNNHAIGALTKDEYDFLWDANRFDMILYFWMKAVHMVRAKCS